ncbi:CoA transferase [Microbacterium sp.]|uniref:CoA transferase n=1 Tax=Microbacterium sp. TaxID=51671 RepID=UPI00333FDF4D
MSPLNPRIRADLALPDIPDAGTSVPLRSHLGLPSLAADAVSAFGQAIALLLGTAVRRPHPLRVAAAYRSDRHLRIDGQPPDVWSPLSGFWRSADGWVRTHANYPHHATALRTALGLSAEVAGPELAEALRRLPGGEAARLITAEGGLCVTVAPEDGSFDARLRALPLVDIRRRADAPRHPLPALSEETPLRGVRVLDLTRVIAGPVATRTLALAGADVLRIDRPDVPEFEWQHLDTGHGKRTALLDVRRSAGALEALLADADVVVLGYRPDALAGLGLSPARLALRHPHLVIATLQAWTEPDRRGFDSLVQASSGIAWAESAEPGVPGALPAQGLDHSAGYLLAAGIVRALQRRADTGECWSVSTSLRRVAAELLGLPRNLRSAGSAPETAETQDFLVGARTVTTVIPAVRWPGAPERFAAPRPWGADAPAWW